MYPASLLTYFTTYVWLRRHKMFSNYNVRLIICQWTLQNRETKKQSFTFFFSTFQKMGSILEIFPLWHHNGHRKPLRQVSTWTNCLVIVFKHSREPKPEIFIVCCWAIIPVGLHSSLGSKERSEHGSNVGPLGYVLFFSCCPCST